MEVLSYKYVKLNDFCRHVGWDYQQTLDMLMDSDVSFGNNDDTLVMPATLAGICERELPENFDHDLMISLGC